MTRSATDTDYRTVWNPLRQAISESSGFQEWRQAQEEDSQLQSSSLDVLVHRYLKETLSTLAY